MRFDWVLAFLLGLIGGLSAVLIYRYLLQSPQEVWVVDFQKLKKEGITKGELRRVLKEGVILIDRRCVLNPAGRDVTEEIEKALKGQ